jgi:formylglycine-generating enzyme required for sulfatase activity
MAKRVRTNGTTKTTVGRRAAAARKPTPKSAANVCKAGAKKKPPLPKPTKPLIAFSQIPSGSFVMGSPAGEIDRCDDEQQVKVQITTSFQIGRTPVTQAQWRFVMRTEPWLDEGLGKNQRGADYPAVYIRWDDAVMFCKTLTALERDASRLTASQVYRLPTEAEWEYACRAGTMTPYSFGKQAGFVPGKDIQAGGGSAWDAYGWDSLNSGERLCTVAKKKPNPWGIHDMHGLVKEWCADWYAENRSGGKDPLGPSTGSQRVVRGGSWHLPVFPRSASRDSIAPQSKLAKSPFRSDTVGFRVVLVVESLDSA